MIPFDQLCHMFYISVFRAEPRLIKFSGRSGFSLGVNRGFHSLCAINRTSETTIIQLCNINEAQQIWEKDERWKSLIDTSKVDLDKRVEGDLFWESTATFGGVRKRIESSCEASLWKHGQRIRGGWSCYAHADVRVRKILWKKSIEFGE